MSSHRLSVTIIQRVLPEYRIKFFSDLATCLDKNGIALKVIYGQEYPGTVPKTQYTNEKWSLRITNKYIHLGNTRFVWQPVLWGIFDADLIIIEQSNSLLVNYIILALRFFGIKKVAFWGHGRNMQARSKRNFSEKLKILLVGCVDWWFAYTDKSVNWIKGTGFPADKITDVQNAIDTSSFKLALDQVTNHQIEDIRNTLNINSDNIMLYCGGMYADKNLDFLIEACHQLKARLPDLYVIFIGSGPEQDKIELAAAKNNWLHYVGPKFGEDRAAYFKLSKALLMPGVVGLTVVDSFTSNTPLFTCNILGHGPEISYLENSFNGVISPATVPDYTDSLYEYLTSVNMQSKLHQGCQESAQKYTLDNMVNNFSTGILDCLKDAKHVN